MPITNKQPAALGFRLPDRLPANVKDMDPETFAELRRIAEALPEVPGVGAVEIAHGEIIMMMSPVARHELAVIRLSGQLNAQLPATHPGFVAYGGADISDPALGRLRRPDIMVFDESALEADVSALRPDQVLLVVEVVSRSNPENDYEEKVTDYKAMGIPHYLIIDPRFGTGAIHFLPNYRDPVKFVFGDTVTVGPWTLDTSVLKTYGQRTEPAHERSTPQSAPSASHTAARSVSEARPAW
jgi:Uma2 family endonuclease